MKQAIDWTDSARKANLEPALLVTPSHGRAGAVMVRRIFPDVTIYCSDSELAAYGERHMTGGPVKRYPDALVGNIARIRNFIRDDNPDRNIVMLDDDVSSFGKFEKGEFNSVPGEAMRAVIEEGFTLATDLGVFLWGINLSNDRKFYREYQPLSFLSPVLGPFTCHRPNPLRYDERFPLKEDYDFALQHLHRYRKLLRLNKYYYNCFHLTNDGGVTRFRTIEREREQLALLQKKWGSSVVTYNLEKSVNPVLHAPLQGI